MCEEMTPRQGCFVGFYPIVHLALTTYADVLGPNNLRTAPMHEAERLKR
jgi:hypothetical protein